MGIFSDHPEDAMSLHSVEMKMHKRQEMFNPDI